MSTPAPAALAPTQKPVPNRIQASPADIEAIKILNQYLQNDTVGINTKLAQYIAVQSLILLGVEKTNWGSLLPFLGIYTSICWFFSMGRTYEFRRHWESEAKALIDGKVGLEAFDFIGRQKLRWFGSVPTSLVQIGIPAIGLIIWVASQLAKR